LVYILCVAFLFMFVIRYVVGYVDIDSLIRMNNDLGFNTWRFISAILTIFSEHFTIIHKK
jgi:hypothetical protein